MQPIITEFWRLLFHSLGPRFSRADLWLHLSPVTTYSGIENGKIKFETFLNLKPLVLYLIYKLHLIYEAHNATKLLCTEKDHKMDSLALQNSGKGRKHSLKTPDFSATFPKPLASLIAFYFLTLCHLHLCLLSFPSIQRWERVTQFRSPRLLPQPYYNRQWRNLFWIYTATIVPISPQGMCSKASKRAYPSHYLEPEIHLPPSRAACFTHNDMDKSALMG